MSESITRPARRRCDSLAEKVKAAVKLSRYITDQGIAVKGGRCIAKWRDGKRESVSIDDEAGTWCDHGNGDAGGSVIDLCMTIENRSAQNAITTLAERYGLNREQQGKPATRCARRVVAEYPYEAADGSTLYTVIRYQPKDFRQYSVGADGRKTWSVKGVKQVPFHLPKLLAAVKDGRPVIVCEGEKDVLTAERLGFTATCNSGGAGKWTDAHAAYLKGAKPGTVFIVADNDGPPFPGQMHAEKVRGTLRAVGVEAVPFTMPKGKDLTEWAEKGHGSDELAALLAEPPPWTFKAEASASDTTTDEANTKNVCNWKLVKDFGKNGKPIEVPAPRLLVDIAADVLDRFGGYPRMLGMELFYFDEQTNEVMSIPRPAVLSAWIQTKGKCGVSFRRGVGYVTMEELHAHLCAYAHRYELASKSPYWPRRDDVFELCGRLPDPNPDASAFWELLDFMCPATEYDRHLMAAAFMAPMYYSEYASRPAWCIDTVDAQGSGKSTVAKIIARLYGCNAIDVDFATLRRDEAAFKKRIISAEGRQSRIALIDNVTGDTVASASLAKFVTCDGFSERCAYGRGEDYRKNDLNWLVTVNGATFDADMASRCYTLKVRKPDCPLPFWEEDVFRFIHDNRPQILADMIFMLERSAAGPREEAWVRHESRFARFDSIVLAAACGTRERFDEIDRYISETADSANVDKSAAEAFEDAFASSIREKYSGPNNERWNGEACVVTPSNMDAFLLSVQELKNYTSRNVREWVRAGMVPSFVKGFDRVCNARIPSEFRRHGSFLYRPSYVPNSPPMYPTSNTKIVQATLTGGEVTRWSVVGETEYRG